MIFLFRQMIRIPAGRGEVARGGQPQSPIAGTKRDDGLHRSLAERASTDDRRTPVIPQSAGNDLGGRSRGAVDQNNKRLALGEIARACRGYFRRNRWSCENALEYA